MLEIRSGLRLFHNNHSVVLIMMTDYANGSENWLVWDVEAQKEIAEQFNPGDTIKFTDGGASYRL